MKENRILRKKEEKSIQKTLDEIPLKFEFTIGEISEIKKFIELINRRLE